MYVKKIISSIALAVTFGLSLTPAAEAACLNNKVPGAQSYIQYYANGDRMIKVWMWDYDFVDVKGLAFYNTQGQILNPTTINQGYADVYLPKGKTGWTAIKDVNSCGQFVRWINGPRF